MSQAPKQERTDEQQVNHRRNKRQQDLKQENVRNGDPAERAIPLPAYCVAVLPDSLERAVGPAKALPDEGLQGLRDLGIGDSVLVIEDFPAPLADRYRQVRVLGHRVAGKSAAVPKKIGAPG